MNNVCGCWGPVSGSKNNVMNIILVKCYYLYKVWLEAQNANKEKRNRLPSCSKGHASKLAKVKRFNITAREKMKQRLKKTVKKHCHFEPLTKNKLVCTLELQVSYSNTALSTAVYLHCPTGKYFAAIHQFRIIVAWWYTCRNVTWLFFLRRIKNT